MPYWTLTTSATDAKRAAIRIARMITGREKALVFSDCYHGGVEEAYVQLVDGQMRMRNDIHPNGVVHARVARVIEFNDVDGLDAALSHGDVACVLTEPVMTNFGMIPPAPGFHEALRAATRSAGALLILDQTHTISCGVGGYTRAHGLDPDMMTLGKTIAGGVPAGVFGASRKVAERVWSVAPWRNPKARQSSHMGMGGTLAGNALTVAAIRAALGGVLTVDAYAQMIARAGVLADGARRIIARHGLSWRVTQVGARCEIMFGPEPPQNGAEAAAMRKGGLETLLHAFYLNEGVLVTPFHMIFLMCPETTEADVEAHGAVFARFVETAIAERAVKP
jgi:glutamate-1-semialdehyde 2,1-aminomutase